ncbi:helix-turn-helix domain-containing protein [Candidatus Parcubacteria bacterium]|nr:helix-turn-helix domain-containing protein [Candidatus Parcubacteria bacterium]
MAAVGEIIRRTILLLKYLQEPRTIKEIADKMGLSKRGAYRCLKGLKEAGVSVEKKGIKENYVTKNGRRRKKTLYCLLSEGGNFEVSQEVYKLPLFGKGKERIIIRPENVIFVFLLDEYVPTDDEFFDGDLN